MSELRVTDEMLAAGVRAMQEHRFPDGSVGVGLTGIHAEGVCKTIVEAAFQAGGFTEEVTFGQTLDPRAKPRAKRLVGPWVPISEVVSDGE